MGCIVPNDLTLPSLIRQPRGSQINGENVDARTNVIIGVNLQRVLC